MFELKTQTGEFSKKGGNQMERSRMDWLGLGFFVLSGGFAISMVILALKTDRKDAKEAFVAEMDACKGNVSMLKGIC